MSVSFILWTCSRNARCRTSGGTVWKFGADAVRYSLVLLTKEGQDVKLSPERFDQGFRFANKVWNAGRFVINAINSLAADGGPRTADHGPSSMVYGLFYFTSS